MDYDFHLNDPLFLPHATYCGTVADRLKKIHNLIRKRQPRSVLDIGFYPGIIGKDIRVHHPNIRLVGIGKLNGVSKFDWYDAIIEAELDPFYGAASAPVMQERYDLIIACEILEHLINPMPMLRLISSSLSDDGVALLTTPNVSSGGAICRLLLGQSNHEKISRSVMVDTSEWRAHIRLYSRSELSELADMTGLQVLEHAYYVNASMWLERKKRLAWLVRMAASLVPRYREDQMVLLARKPAPLAG